ncbi:hypothetical protein BH10ACT4_BH10ACT4_10130 [soil metagenome]
MRTAAERVLFVSFGVLLVAAVALSWYNANSPTNYSGGNKPDQVPWPIIWAQVASSAASVFAEVALAAAAGLLFLRAARWTGALPDDEDPTPEPSP